MYHGNEQILKQIIIGRAYEQMLNKQVVCGWMAGWMDGWVDGWMDEAESGFKDCSQQSKI